MNQLPLNVQNLSKKFDKFTAVDNISFDLKEGEILGLLGPNGAGKTTTIQMLIGTLTMSSGQILYWGDDINQKREKILQKVGYASSFSRLPSELTGEEVLNYTSYLFKLDRTIFQKTKKELSERFGFTELLKKPSYSLSAGQATRLNLLKCFINNPRVVLLDEPTASLDPEIAQEVVSFIQEQQKEKGISIIYTSHIMSEIMTLCNRVVFLKQGKILEIDTPYNLARKVGNFYVRIRLNSFESDLAKLKSINLENLEFIPEEDCFFKIKMEEINLDKFIFELGRNQINFSKFSINHSSLEEYFIENA